MSSLGVAIPLMVCVLIAILWFLKWIEEDKAHLESAHPERDHQWINKLRKQPFNLNQLMQTGHVVRCTPRPQEKIDCE